LRQGERVVDELDIADLLSERQHGYNLPRPHVGFVRYRLLLDPDEPSRELFDAGRIVPSGEVQRARMRTSQGQARLIVRVAPEQQGHTVVRIDGREIGAFHEKPRRHVWQELSVRLPEGIGPELELELESDSDAVHYHVWIVEAER
jgi:hypothetical protein